MWLGKILADDICFAKFFPATILHYTVHMCCYFHPVGSPKWIHLTRTESQSIYTALQSSDINEIARALHEQQVTIVTVIE